MQGEGEAGLPAGAMRAKHGMRYTVVTVGSACRVDGLIVALAGESGTP